MAITVYQVTRATYTKQTVRGTDKTVRTSYDNFLYTSSNKAADRARSLAACVFPDLVNSYYKAFVNGSAKAYDEYLIYVTEYHESEGKLNFVRNHYLLETDQGNTHNYENKDPFFTSI